MQGLLQQILFQGWEPLLRTAIGTTVTYLALVILLRLAGQRTLAKWYAFDLIVTVALGSTFANSVLTNNITVAQSLVGFVILVGSSSLLRLWSSAGATCGSSSIRSRHWCCIAENSSRTRCAGSALRSRCASRGPPKRH